MKLMAENGISQLKYQQKDETLELSREAPTVASEPATQLQTGQTSTSPTSATNTINAKFVGVFYTSGSPEDPPFVKVGDTVKAGQTVAVIEAMKMMNNVVAPQSGRITKVLVANEELVEFDQPLFEFESL